jgi:Rrf2 family transcriptional regulator, cysteine metabolism repressor
MKISTRGRYGLRLLLDLAVHQDEGPVALKDIADRQQLPLAYLKHLTPPLVSKGILLSARGFKGGLLLAKDPSEIKLSEIFGALETPIALSECAGDLGECETSSFSVTRDILMELQKSMEEVLGATTLKDMMERQWKKEQLVPAMSGDGD